MGNSWRDWWQGEEGIGEGGAASAGPTLKRILQSVRNTTRDGAAMSAPAGLDVTRFLSFLHAVLLLTGQMVIK